MEYVTFSPLEDDLVMIDSAACELAFVLAASGSTLDEARAIGAWLQ